MTKMIFKVVAVFTIIQVFCLQLNLAQLLTFKDGRIGVNFGGYHASAGLGGGSNGGFLSAEAGTPFGPAARAGLGGGMNRQGVLGGKLYADATAGRGVGARAGLGGAVDGREEEPKAGGELYAGAQAGRSAQAAAGLRGRTVGGENAYVDGQIYSGAAAAGRVGSEAGLAGRVGSDDPPSGIIYTKTVSPDRYAYKINKEVETSKGIKNRFNDQSDESNSSEEDEENKQKAFIPLGGLNHEAGLEDNRQEGGLTSPTTGGKGPLYTKAVPSKQSAGRDVYVTKTKVVRPSAGSQYQYNDDRRNEVLGDANQRSPVDDGGDLNFNKYFEAAAGPYPPVEQRPIVILRKRPHHHHPKHPKRVIYQETPSAYTAEETAASGDVDTGVVYTKRYRPGGSSFFDDIFNIPISALTAVRGFLTNNVGKGAVEVQKIKS